MGTITKIRGNEPQTIEEAREEIADIWLDHKLAIAEGKAETLRRLHEAKKHLPYEEWIKLWNKFGKRRV
jgi:hypothetical protein